MAHTQNVHNLLQQQHNNLHMQMHASAQQNMQALMDLYVVVPPMLRPWVMPYN